MVRVPTRLLIVVALAGLVFGGASLLKIGSSPAQDVAPPSPGAPSEVPPVAAGEAPPGAAGSSGDSSPGFVGGTPGVSGGSPGSPGGNPGIPGNNNGTVQSISSPANPSGPGNPDDVVSSVVNPNEPAFEWTLERMLLATPMPMTQEERDFLFKHKPLEQIRDWTQDQFNAYVAEPLGVRQAAQEGIRWRDLVNMLEKQHKAGAKVLGIKVEDKVRISDGKQSVLDQFDKADPDKFEKMIRESPPAVFNQMKIWRQDIATLAPKVEAMRKKAEKKGIADKFENALSESE